MPKLNGLLEASLCVDDKERPNEINQAEMRGA